MKQLHLFLLLAMLGLFGIRSEELVWQTKQDDFSVSLSIASSSLPIQETLPVNADLSYPSSYSVSIETFTQSFNLFNSNWSLVNQYMISSESDDRKTLHLEFELAPSKAGDLFLSLFDIRFSTVSESSTVIWTPIFTIHVTPAVELSSFIAPVISLEPQYQASLSLSNRQRLYGSSALAHEVIRIQHRLDMQSFPWLFVLFVILGSAGWLLWKFFRHSQAHSTPAPRLTPSQEALGALQVIQQQNLLRQEQYKEYFIGLTNLLRRYIESRFNVPVRFKTTDEFLSYLEPQVHFPLEFKKFLQNFLFQADQVKFAKHLPSLQECEEAYSQIKRFIQENHKEPTEKEV